MKKQQKSNSASLSRKRNAAREKLYTVMTENEHEWQFARKMLKSYESQFIKLWEAYKTDRNYIEDKFFECCNNLHYFIYQERKMDKEFKKIYKPYYDKFQKLNKEYSQLKNQQRKGKKF